MLLPASRVRVLLLLALLAGATSLRMSPLTVASFPCLRPAVMASRLCRSTAACAVPSGCGEEGNDDEEDEEADQLVDDEWVGLVDGSSWDADAAWIRFKLVMIEQEYGSIGPAMNRRVGPRFRLPSQLPVSAKALLGAIVGAGSFMLVLHAYLASTGGIVIVPEGVTGVTALNFEELKQLSSQDADLLLRLGIPMPAASTSPVEAGIFAGLLRRFQ